MPSSRCGQRRQPLHQSRQSCATQSSYCQSVGGTLLPVGPDGKLLIDRLCTAARLCFKPSKLDAHAVKAPYQHATGTSTILTAIGPACAGAFILAQENTRPCALHTQTIKALNIQYRPTTSALPLQPSVDREKSLTTTSWIYPRTIRAHRFISSFTS